MFDRTGHVQCVGCGDEMKVHGNPEVMLHATCVNYRCEKCDRELQFMLPRGRQKWAGNHLQKREASR